MSERNDTSTVVRSLSHRNDPDASRAAADYQRRSSRRNELLKAAILDLLAEEPRTAFELREAYFGLRVVNGWPLVQENSVNRRLSDLRNAGFVRPVMVDEHDLRRPSPSGATATVWELA